MESIIETLYNNLDRPQPLNDPELEKLKEEYSQMSNLIKSHYGVDFLDRYAALWTKINKDKPEEAFSAGFRTCARLMLEALRVV